MCVVATRAAFAGRVPVSLMVSAAKEGESGTCGRIIKMHHAGEFGAVVAVATDRELCES